MIQDVGDITSFKWATVSVSSPLAIKLDGDTAALALVPDSLIDPLSLAVGDRVRVELSLRKCVIHGAANGGVMSGEGKVWFGSIAPYGWFLCQGQSLLRSQYPRLFAVIGTTYGAADSTHFTLPNVMGKVIVGRDPGQTEFDTLGESGGAKTHTLTLAESPAHSHVLSHAAAGGGSTALQASGIGLSGWVFNYLPTSTVGGGGAHNNLQPYTVANYIIKI